MAHVRFTAALKRFFPSITEMEAAGGTVKEILDQINQKHPGILQYLVDEHGALRNHVNIYLQGSLIHDRILLLDSVNAKDEILIFQALSGG